MSQDFEHDPRQSSSSPIDPLLARRLADQREHRPRTGSGDKQRPAHTSSRRRHPARGARTIALLASLASTGGVATALAASEGAFSSADAGLESADPSAGGAGSSTEAPASTELSASAVVTSEPTESTTSVAATTVATSVATTTATTEVEAAVTEVTAQAAPETVVVTSGYGDGVYLGSAEYTEWGNVQVELTISGGAVVDVVAVQLPSDRKSARINDRAEPLLDAQAVEMQSADLDIVSGATYTSRTYADSLQAALDQASLAASQAIETVAS